MLELSLLTVKQLCVAANWATEERCDGQYAVFHVLHLLHSESIRCWDDMQSCGTRAESLTGCNDAGC